MDGKNVLFYQDQRYLRYKLTIYLVLSFLALIVIFQIHYDINSKEGFMATTECNDKTTLDTCYGRWKYFVNGRKFDGWGDDNEVLRGHCQHQPSIWNTM